MSEESERSAGGPPGIRASDADREQLIDELQTHTVAGRLSTEELEERTQAAYAARTTAELSALRRDLPAQAPSPALARRERRAQLSRRLAQEAGGSAGVFLLCVIIWAASGAQGQFWPVWVLIPLALLLARSSWALYGPAADLDAVERDLDRRREERAGRDERRARERRRHLGR